MVAAQVREMIGRVSITPPLRFSPWTIDTTIPDYCYWDMLSRGKQQGYELGGLFAAPIASVTRDWVLGKGADVMLADDGNAPVNVSGENDPRAYTNDVLKRFMQRNHAILMTMIYDLYRLGDQYIIVNPDGSLSIPSPDTVEAKYDEQDYRKLSRVTVTTRFPNRVVTDVYTDTMRTITVEILAHQVKEPNGTYRHVPASRDSVEYPNLIGRIPVVHFANERSANETHGHPIYEALLHLFSRYNDLLESALEGADLLSKPVPVFEGIKDVEAAKDANSEPTGDSYYDEDNDLREDRRIEFNHLSAIFVPEGGSFKWAAPGSFTSDTRELLKLLFLLLLDRSRLPEVVWGNELGQARASSSEQMETFYMYVHGRRVMLEGEGADDVLQAESRGGILELIDIWLNVRSLTDPRIVVAPVTMKWPALGRSASETKLKWVQYLDGKGYITPQTAVREAEIVENADAEVEKAAQMDTPAPDTFDAAMTADLQAAQQTLQDSAPNEPQPVEVNDAASAE